MNDILYYNLYITDLGRRGRLIKIPNKTTRSLNDSMSPVGVRRDQVVGEKDLCPRLRELPKLVNGVKL